MTSTVIQAPKRFKFEEVLSKLKQSGEVLDDDDGSDGSVMSDSEDLFGDNEDEDNKLEAIDTPPVVDKTPVKRSKAPLSSGNIANTPSPSRSKPISKRSRKVAPLALPSATEFTFRQPPPPPPSVARAASAIVTRPTNIGLALPGTGDVAFRPLPGAIRPSTIMSLPSIAAPSTAKLSQASSLPLPTTLNLATPAIGPAPKQRSRATKKKAIDAQASAAATVSTSTVSTTSTSGTSKRNMNTTHEISTTVSEVVKPQNKTQGKKTNTPVTSPSATGAQTLTTGAPSKGKGRKSNAQPAVASTHAEETTSAPKVTKPKKQVDSSMSKPTKAEVKKSAGKKSKKQVPLPNSATAAVATTPTAASSTRKRPGEAFDASAETSGPVSKKRKISEGVQLSTIAYVVDIFVQRIDRRLFDADPNIKAKARSDHISWKRFGFYPQEVVDIFQKEKEAKEKMIQEQQSRKEAKRQETALQGKEVYDLTADDAFDFLEEVPRSTVYSGPQPAHNMHQATMYGHQQAHGSFSDIPRF